MTKKRETPNYHIYKIGRPGLFGRRDILLIATSMKDALSTVPDANEIVCLKGQIVIKTDVWKIMKKQKPVD
jgi:hypothetical protein